MSARLLRWAVLLVRLDPVEGHEQAGQLPILVVSYEPFHQMGLLTVVPITSARAAPRLPGDVAIPAGEAGLTRSGVIICSQLRTISLLRVVAERGTANGLRYVISPVIRQQVREAIAHHMGLDVRAPIDGADGTAQYREQ